MVNAGLAAQASGIGHRRRTTVTEGLKRNARTEGSPRHALGRCPSHRMIQRFSGSTGADLGQDDNNDDFQGDRTGGHERVSATPAKPSTRTTPPIIVATIPTYFRSPLFSDIAAGALSQLVCQNWFAWRKLAEILIQPNPLLRPCQGRSRPARSLSGKPSRGGRDRARTASLEWLVSRHLPRRSRSRRLEEVD